MAEISKEASDIVSSIITQRLFKSMTHDETPTPPGTMISFGCFLDKPRGRKQTLSDAVYVGDVTRELAESGDWTGITVGSIFDSQGKMIPGRGVVSAISKIRLR